MSAEHLNDTALEYHMRLSHYDSLTLAYAATMQRMGEVLDDSPIAQTQGCPVPGYGQSTAHRWGTLQPAARAQLLH